MSLHFPSTINIPCFSISTLSSVSSVPFSLQSLSPPTSPQPEVQVSTPSIPPPDLVTEDKSPGHRTVEVAIPNVGTFVIESEEGGYDDEVALAQTNLLPVWHMEWEHHCPFTWLYTRFFTPEKIWHFLPTDFRIDLRLKTLSQSDWPLCWPSWLTLVWKVSSWASLHLGTKTVWPFAESLDLWKNKHRLVLWFV